MAITTVSGGIFNFLETDYSAPTWSGSAYDFMPTYIERLVLSGYSNNFVAIWADANANIHNAKMYVSSAGSNSALSVINLFNKVLIDSYSTTVSGQNKELLEYDDIVDINIGL